jgi:hypothetical protein
MFDHRFDILEKLTRSRLCDPSAYRGIEKLPRRAEGWNVRAV